MSVLVTGAGGFLGRAVVDAFGRRGQSVRAMVRPAASVDGLWAREPQVVRADLRAGPLPSDALDDVEVVVHLAAALAGDLETQFATTVTGTERLLDAMVGSGTRRLVLASSFSVYDWHAAEEALTERTPLTGFDEARGPYTLAKLWQERIVRRFAERHGIALVVLRPGFIWGPGHLELGGLGPQVGRARIVVGPRTRLPLTHIDNCAESFAIAAERIGEVTGTFNVVDGDEIRTWRYAGELRDGGDRVVRVPVPYSAALAVARAARRTAEMLFPTGGKLPSVLNPAQVEARFKPLRFPSTALRESLAWEPSVSFAEAMKRSRAA